MNETDEKLKELIPLLTDDFLSTLVEAGKVCGWSVDHIETIEFIRWCHDEAGRECPDIEAYSYQDE